MDEAINHGNISRTRGCVVPKNHRRFHVTLFETSQSTVGIHRYLPLDKEVRILLYHNILKQYFDNYLKMLISSAMNSFCTVKNGILRKASADVKGDPGAEKVKQSRGTRADCRDDECVG